MKFAGKVKLLPQALAAWLMVTRYKLVLADKALCHITQKMIYLAWKCALLRRDRFRLSGR